MRDYQTNQEIHIVFATDEIYVKQTIIAILSLMRFADRNSDYYLHIIVEKKAKSEFERYISIVTSRYKNAYICLIDVPELALKGSKLGHITSMTYARLFIPILLSDLSRCVYLDSDVIVEGIIDELYDLYMDGNYIGGVKSAGYHEWNERKKSEYCAITGLFSIDQYINAGVLVMDLKALRNSGFTEKAIDLISQDMPSRDQDIINLLCYDHILLLPPKYNVTHSVLDKTDVPNHTFSFDEITEACQTPYIIHYTTSAKPWNMVDIAYSERWWKVCVETPFYNKMVREMSYDLGAYLMLSKEGLWREPCYSKEWSDSIKVFNDVYIYGFGSVALKVIEKLLGAGIRIKGILVSTLDESSSHTYKSIPINEYNHDLSIKDLVLVAVKRNSQLEIKNYLRRDGLIYIYYMS